MTQSKDLPGQQRLFPGIAPEPESDRLAPLQPRVNSSVPEIDVARLSRQQQRLLARLQQGPATNVELSRIALRYSARLEELRRAGVHWTKERLKPGVYRYSLG